MASDECVLTDRGNGVFVAPGARIIDRSGRKRLPIGRDGFVSAMREGTLVDKTMLIADVLDSGYAATLFCRPRRFGKTLNMTMMKAFFEAPEAGGLSREEAERVFAGTDAWEAKGGSYRQYQGAYPVVNLSLGTATGSSWHEVCGTLRLLIQTEFSRHHYLADSELPLESDMDLFHRVETGVANGTDYVASLAALCRMLRAYHQHDVVLLIDEYDAPIIGARAHGYYDEVVSFMRRWLTGAIKDGGAALAFACLTGVQRISKESIFSGLNSLYVDTPLQDDFDERYGFTDAEVETLATYLGHPGCMPEAREWYDGYHFGAVDVYNPWSVINYLNKGCKPAAYWGNTSGNSVLGELVTRADADTLEQIYRLLEPGGETYARLDQGVVFPDLDQHPDAVWSMLYLAGYITTDDTVDPSDDMRLRPMRLPNREVRRLFRNEVLSRFIGVVGGNGRLTALHRSLLAGDQDALEDELSSVISRASYYDLTSGLACHMLLMGLLFGVRGYHDPVSNWEFGDGRPDIRLEPDPAQRVPSSRPLVTLEVKFSRNADGAALKTLARDALGQIADRSYDAELPNIADGRLRWGVAFSGKHVACACERA